MMSEEDIRYQAARILIDAATYIRTYGWQVSGMSQHGLPRCSMGALASANRDKVWDKSLAALMYETLYDELDGLSLTEFNHLHQNGETVIQLFEAVAARLAHRKIAVLT